MKKHTDSFIAECKAVLSALVSERAKLLKDKELIDTKLNDLEARARPYREILKAQGIEPAGANLQGKSSNADRAYSILIQFGAPMHVRKLWEAMVEAGARTDSEDPLNMLASILARDKRFTRTAPRTFTLSTETAGKETGRLPIG